MNKTITFNFHSHAISPLIQSIQSFSLAFAKCHHPFLHATFLHTLPQFHMDLPFHICCYCCFCFCFCCFCSCFCYTIVSAMYDWMDTYNSMYVIYSYQVPPTAAAAAGPAILSHISVGLVRIFHISVEFFE
jgi:hypothetical protein